MLDIDNSSLLLSNICRGTLDDAKRLSSSSSRLVKLVSTSGTIAGTKPYCWTANFGGFEKHVLLNAQDRSRYRMTYQVQGSEFEKLTLVFLHINT